MTKEPKLFELTVTNAKQSTNWTSYVLAVLVMIITASALIAKWSMLQPLHNDLVYKFRNNLSLYYEPKSICHLMNSQDYNLVTFPFFLFPDIVVYV